MSPNVRYIRFFDEIGLDDVPLVGGKNASLGEMVQALVPRGVKVPDGFAITAEAYRALLDANDLVPRLQDALAGLDPEDTEDLARRGARCRELVYDAALPEEMARQILEAYTRLKAEYGDKLTVAVRSSATAEDLPDVSFAGAHETFLHVHGEGPLLDAVRRCFASLFTDRGISYRINNGFDHFKVALSVGVQKMVRSDLAASGVIFTLDTESGFRDVIFLTGSWGLGENIVQGAVDPDEFYVFKPTFEKGHRAVLRRSLGGKKVKMVYAERGVSGGTRNVPVPHADQTRFCLSDDEVLTLADYALEVEKHYTERAGTDRPMDLEWAKDGADGELYLVQARPETVISQRTGMVMETYRLEGRGQVLASGRAVGEKIASGPVRVALSLDSLHDFKTGEVLVADTTTPDWEPVMKRAAAIVTNRGGRTCHAAIVARELGIPAVVGADDATRKLEHKRAVTVSCADGDEGHVYQGEVPFTVDRTDLSRIEKPRTRVMVNLGNPELAFKVGQLPSDGVGLARMEFIISEHIKVHPMALVHPDKVEDPVVRLQIARLTAGYDDPTEYFVERLAEGVGTIAAGFYPRPVVVRMSDFKTNEYASLLGGAAFEPTEANPMLGFRGASRYTHPAYAEGFAMECAAMRRVREDMGLTNVRLMIPFCRRVEEGAQVVKHMAELGLKRGQDGLEIYVMCEIPNNVVQLDRFAEHFDGFSIGSNDLTQLVLGVDRDSALVAFDYDERDAGVMEMIRLAVQGCQRAGRHSGFCGQAPSDYPEMAAYLVELGIDSMSVTPDTLLKTLVHVVEVEQRLGRGARKARKPWGEPGRAEVR